MKSDRINIKNNQNPKSKIQNRPMAEFIYVDRFNVCLSKANGLRRFEDSAAAKSVAHIIARGGQCVSSRFRRALQSPKIIWDALGAPCCSVRVRRNRTRFQAVVANAPGFEAVVIDRIRRAARKKIDTGIVAAWYATLTQSR